MNSAFYELKHEIGADYFTVERNHDFSFPLHMHRCFELILVQEGSMTVTVEKRDYVLVAGDMILVKPNLVHALRTEDTSRHVLCIFAPELIAAISDELIRYRLSSPVIRGLSDWHRCLFENASEGMNVGGVKGVLYSICDLFYSQLDVTKEDTAAGISRLLQKILLYVDEHMGQPCQIRDLGAFLDYSPAYLSRFFYTNVGISYSDYVRNIKINYACYLLQNTNTDIYHVSKKCGYATQSSFNRSFKQIVGCKPGEYRGRMKNTNTQNNKTDTP